MLTRRSRALLVTAVLVAASGGLSWWAFSGGSEPSWSFPSVEGDTTRLVGGAVFDVDGPVAGAVVQLGVGGATLAADASTTVTAVDGSFVVALNEELAAAHEDDDLFVDITLRGVDPDGRSDLLGSEVTLRRAATIGRLDHEVRAPRRRPCTSEEPQGCELRLPDLVPVIDGVSLDLDQALPPESVSIDETTQPGRRLLRFSSITTNLGEGPLHVVRTNEPANGRIPTLQRVWTGELGFSDELAGEFVFHPGHDHVHLDAFERYRLLDGGGIEVATAVKVSFCLMDSLAVDGWQDEGSFRVGGDELCGDEQQAINIGFADYYGAELVDQWIDVTGVPAGEYTVEIVVDPEGFLIESDKTNNTVRFAVTIPPAS